METAKDYEVLPWNWLFGRARNSCLGPVQREWEDLLRNFSRETDLTRFVSRYAGLFFCARETHFVLSELRLGADHAIDLVVPTDQASLGVEYCLIELERPDTPALNPKGHPTARLSHALGQISDWQNWIKQNSDTARRLFPAPAQMDPTLDVAFTYVIVIGRRTDAPHFRSSRNNIAKMTGVAIRTFDWLDDLLRSAASRPSGPLTPSAEAIAVPFDIAESLKNPFFSALSDAAWRDLLLRLRTHPHLVPANAEIFAQTRSYAEESLARFREYCAEFPEERDSAVEQERQLYSEIIARQNGA